MVCILFLSCFIPCHSLYFRLVPKLFYNCDQGQADPVVAVARDQSSVYLKLLMHETQPASQFAVSTVTRYSYTSLPPSFATKTT